MKPAPLHLHSDLHTACLEGLRVFVRADLNVPTEHGHIIADHRLIALLPTLELIKRKGGRIILATHKGRPSTPNDNDSTKILVPWFKRAGFVITYEPDLEHAYVTSKMNFGDILLLENLRFFPGEKDNTMNFAHQLARLGDYYVNDAFGVLHRTDTSITITPTLFAPNKRTIGLLVEKEIQTLNKLLENPKRPFVLILGGAKIKDKLPLIASFLPQVDTILLCPALVFTFLHAHNTPVGKSLIDSSVLAESIDILNQAQKNKVRIVFPVDYQVAHETFDGPVSYISSTDIPSNAVGVSIGPKTAQLFAHEIEKAHTVFLNGVMGNEHNKETLFGMHAVLQAMATNSDALTVVGGGDSVAVTQELGFADKIDYCSTGGGATLSYLSGHMLPGLQIFLS
jgi:phosphoglycerate kinase